MKTSDLLELKFDEDSKELLTKVLLKTTWLERFQPEDLTVEKLEVLYNKVRRKYPGRISYILPAGGPEDVKGTGINEKAPQISYACYLINSKTQQRIGLIYFISVWECLAKSILLLYAYFVKGQQGQ